MAATTELIHFVKTRRDQLGLTQIELAKRARSDFGLSATWSREKKAFGWTK